MVASRRISLSFALLAAILIACGGGKSSHSLNLASFSPLAAARTKPPDSATFNAVISCAAGSTARFLAVQRQASFAVYCPTYLPAGFELVSVSVGPGKPGAPVDGLTAVFTNAAIGEEIDFSQYVLGGDIFPPWRQYGPPTRLGDVSYGGVFSAALYDVWSAPSQPKSAVVWGDAPDGRQHIIAGNSTALDASTMRRIAEGMTRVRSQ